MQLESIIFTHCADCNSRKSLYRRLYSTHSSIWRHVEHGELDKSTFLVLVAAYLTCMWVSKSKAWYQMGERYRAQTDWPKTSWVISRQNGLTTLIAACPDGPPADWAWNWYAPLAKPEYVCISTWCEFRVSQSTPSNSWVLMVGVFLSVKYYVLECNISCEHIFTPLPTRTKHTHEHELQALLSSATSLTNAKDRLLLHAWLWIVKIAWGCLYQIQAIFSWLKIEA